MTTATNIVERASRLLLDTSNLRWTATELLEYLNEARAFVATVRPDAFATTVAYTMTRGTPEQPLPATALSLLRVKRLDGRYLRRADLNAASQIQSCWPEREDVPVEFSYDPREPRTFQVYPTPDTAEEVELTVALRPTALAGGDTLDLGVEYEAPLLEYVLHKAYYKEGETQDTGRSDRHYTRAAEYLGADGQARASYAPVSGGSG